MPKINLLNKINPFQIEVVRPFGELRFGRLVANSRDIRRRELLVESFNHISSYLRKHYPNFIDQFVSHENLQLALDLCHESLKRFIRTGRLRVEDISLHIFKRTRPEEGLDALIAILNSACAFTKINGERLEFYMGDAPGFPGAVIKMKRSENAVPSFLVDPSVVRKNLSQMDGAFQLEQSSGKNKQPLTAIEIKNVYERHYGPASLQLIRDALEAGNNEFYPVIRARQFEHAERLYVYRKGDAQNMAEVYTLQRTRSAFAFKSDLPELLREGRVYQVFGYSYKQCYFTAEEFTRYLEQGWFYRTTSGEYVDMEMAKDVLRLSDAYRPKKAHPSAARYFLEFYKNKELTADIKNAYPFLSLAIEVLRSNPQGAEEYLEAARIAAEYNVPETMLAAILLARDFSHARGSWVLTESKSYRLENYFYEQLRDRGISWNECTEKSASIRAKLNNLRENLAFKLDLIKEERTEDILNFLIHFDHKITSQGEIETRVAYLASTLAKLRHTPVDGLSKNELRHLLVIVAPLAEKNEYLELAAEIRNEVFRIAYNQEYVRIKREIEEVTGMTYPEMEAHIESTVDYIKQVFDAVGLKPDQHSIKRRIKLPYSAWEKLRSLGVSHPGLLKDIFGVNVVVEHSRIAYTIMKILRQAFRELNEANFIDRYGIVEFLQKRNYPVFIDQIEKPKPNGYSALFYHCLSELNLPLEVQVTTTGREKINRGHSSPHWVHKVKREIKSYFGIDAQDVEKMVQEIADSGRVPDLPIYSKREEIAKEFFSAFTNWQARSFARSQMMINYTDAIKANHPNRRALDPKRIKQKVGHLISTIFDRIEEVEGRPDQLYSLMQSLSRSASPRDRIWFREYLEAYDHYKHHNKLEKRDKLLSPFIVGESLVDIGCGGGDQAAFIKQHHKRIARVAGIDVLNWENPGLDINYHELDFSIPGTSSPEKYDTGMLLAVLHHASRTEADVATFLSGVRTAVKKRLIVEEDVLFTPEDLKLNLPGLEKLAEMRKKQPTLDHYLGLSAKDQKDVATIIDFLANSLSVGVPSMAFPFGFRSLSDWVRIFDQNGFSLNRIKVLGFQKGNFNQQCHLLFILDKK